MYGELISCRRHYSLCLSALSEIVGFDWPLPSFRVDQWFSLFWNNTFYVLSWCYVSLESLCGRKTKLAMCNLGLVYTIVIITTIQIRNAVEFLPVPCWWSLSNLWSFISLYHDWVKSFPLRIRRKYKNSYGRVVFCLWCF